jgi:UDP-N-acetyl-D-glucosamine/UDP-N-acetyl-D-galactosamine dehydrogenase
MTTTPETIASTNPRAAWRDDLADVRIAVIGLGYVGLPVAAAMSVAFGGAVGIDLDARKVAAVNARRDVNDDLDPAVLARSRVRASTQIADARNANVYIIAVPTDIDRDRRPDLAPLLSATRSVGSVLAPGDVVVYESTVYPGLTEDVCGPELERASGLKPGRDVFLAYSPERINPGDREHTLERIVKVVAAQDDATLRRIAGIYERIVTAGVHRAPSIKVAEAAKVIENTQRDLNIALVNELAIIFDRMGIRTADVLAAAATKWNFLRFHPGLVGGHCIGIDPYYLTTRAEQLGYHPDVILAGRRINDGMGAFVANKTIKLLLAGGCDLRSARVILLGVTFKEDVRDVRNSKSPDIVRELQSYGIHVDVVDPLADPDTVSHEYGLALSTVESLAPADGLILSVPHATFLEEETKWIRQRVRPGGVIVDVKSRLDPRAFAEYRYWSL